MMTKEELINLPKEELIEEIVRMKEAIDENSPMVEEMIEQTERMKAHNEALQSITDALKDVNDLIRKCVPKNNRHMRKINMIFTNVFS